MYDGSATRSSWHPQNRNSARQIDAFVVSYKWKLEALNDDLRLKMLTDVPAGREVLRPPGILPVAKVLQFLGACCGAAAAPLYCSNSYRTSCKDLESMILILICS